jgi:hypothetical protein
MRQRAVGVLVAALVVAGVVGVAEAASPKQVAQANRALAIGNGDQLLDGLVLPSGATQVRKEPSGDAGQLERGDAALWYAAEVDRVRFWVTSATPAAVISSVGAHVPKGAASGGIGWSGSPDASSFESWSLPTVDGGRLGERLLDVEAVQLTDGETGVRADAWVQYAAPRPYAQRVPAQARILDITVTRDAKLVSSRELTNTAAVRRIAAVADALPFVGGPDVAIACPELGGPDERFDTLRFRASPGGRALATVSMWSSTPNTGDPCEASSLWIRGHSQRSLADGGVLLKAAGLK